MAADSLTSSDTTIDSQRNVDLGRLLDSAMAADTRMVGESPTTFNPDLFSDRHRTTYLPMTANTHTISDPQSTSCSQKRRRPYGSELPYGRCSAFQTASDPQTASDSQPAADFLATIDSNSHG